MIFSHRLKRGLLLASLMGACALAQAHAKLADSLPKAGSQLEVSPSVIRLQFSAPLEAAFSKIRLLNARDADIALTELARDSAHPDTMAATPPVLPSGSYRVEWSAVTHDGHKTKGEFAFAVK